MDKQQLAMNQKRLLMDKQQLTMNQKQLTNNNLRDDCER
jgi:hypothetical protein